MRTRRINMATIPVTINQLPKYRYLRGNRGRRIRKRICWGIIGIVIKSHDVGWHSSSKASQLSLLSVNKVPQTTTADNSVDDFMSHQLISLVVYSFFLLGMLQFIQLVPDNEGV